MKKFLYYILHSLTNCSDKDLEYSRNGRKAVCKSCGRKYIIWNN